MAEDWTGNLHSVYGCLGTHNGNTKDREENDYYAWYVWEKGYKGKTTLRWFN